MGAQLSESNGVSGQREDVPFSAVAGGASRRRLLASALAAGAAVGTGAWRSAPRSAAGPAGAAGPTDASAGHQTFPEAANPALRKPGSLPYPKLAAGTDTIPQVKHIVVLMMENHSYDNHLGMLSRAGADGFKLDTNGKPTETNPYPDGKLQHAFRMPTTCQLSGKPSQTWTNSHIQLAGGHNTGFVRSGSGPVAMGYWEKADLPFYYSLASTFPIADHYFCSMLGQTFPNRRYLMAATSLGMVNDGVPDPLHYPANGTIFDRLHKIGVSFGDYYSLLESILPAPTMALFPELLVKYAGHLHDLDDFFEAAKAGTLPGFCLVEPSYTKNSEENPENIAYGEQFAASVIDAVMAGPGWKNTLLIWTFDEHGGYYDHVVPPAALAPDDIAPDASVAYTGFRQYGFRVPCAIVSPWARADYVSHEVFDHTSICALVEHKWNLPALTYRDANANPMLDMLDLTKPAFEQPPKLARPLLDTHPGALACNTSGPGTIPPPGSIT
ncbi:MAG TPA: alkaline phosphatase family protein [Streptosporangiaceae bacterium]|nr:alkaline phosphatase family protein [Streptosporangiaceae bacterium]